MVFGMLHVFQRKRTSSRDLHLGSINGWSPLGRKGSFSSWGTANISPHFHACWVHCNSTKKNLVSYNN